MPALLPVSAESASLKRASKSEPTEPDLSDRLEITVEAERFLERGLNPASCGFSLSVKRNEDKEAIKPGWHIIAMGHLRDDVT